MKRNGFGIWGIVFAAVAVPVVLLGLIAFQPAPRSYSFVKVDHPVDMWGDGPDKWAYYSIDEGTTPELAAEVRKTLLSDGFVEDSSQKPWFCFTKGKIEVVVCNHDEFAVNNSLFGSKIMMVDEKRNEEMLKKMSPSGIAPTHKWPCILVKNGPGTSEPVGLFTIQKIINRW